MASSSSGGSDMRVALVSAVVSAAVSAVFTFGIPAASEAIEFSGDPVVSTVQVHPAENEESGLEYAFAEPLHLSAQEIDKLNKMDRGTFLRWVRSRGGAQAGALYATLTIEGNRSQQVEITGIHVKKKCRPPLTGTYMDAPSETGGGPVYKMAFNLEETSPAAHRFESNEISGDYFEEERMWLAPHEQQTIKVEVDSGRQYCDFTFEMSVVDDGEISQVSINDSGRHFLLTPSLIKPGDEPHRYAAYRDLYVDGAMTHGSRWIRKNPATYDTLEAADGKPRRARNRRLGQGSGHMLLRTTR
ncbi:hypothetical protein [Streptomyces sp. 2314.4]|uniref:hypothetical protein n=1 Tax=Streptomyces sp. 2314.4 TaxID=1881025 RepID=UPI000896CD57|nr:hypothetical protein [Streptomyces sp. 2314.4]SEC12551.1 hypothetical protein SAMN05428943_1080 [Streptomyces sp. 2314.4]